MWMWLSALALGPKPPTYHLFPKRVRLRGFFNVPICGLMANDSGPGAGAGVAVGVAVAVVVAVESPPVWATAGLGAMAVAKPITASAAKTASILVNIRSSLLRLKVVAAGRLRQADAEP